MQHAQETGHSNWNVRHVTSSHSTRDEHKAVRSRFDLTVKQLPKIKGNTLAPASESKVAAWLDSTYSKSTKCQSVTATHESKDGQSCYPAYY